MPLRQSITKRNAARLKRPLQNLRNSAPKKRLSCGDERNFLRGEGAFFAAPEIQQGGANENQRDRQADPQAGRSPSEVEAEIGTERQTDNTEKTKMQGRG